MCDTQSTVRDEFREPDPQNIPKVEPFDYVFDQLLKRRFGPDLITEFEPDSTE
jgi:hypothetical protein